jgi:crossover junction endodeoxyribonuclease RuvC
MSHRVRILGIDPGLRKTGWGVIDVDGARVSFVACGSVEPNPKLDFGPRLALLHEGLTKIVRDFGPDEAAVEETFVNADSRSALKLGAARGVAMLVPAQAGLPTGEYAPNHVKKTVVGAGHAEKAQIRLMVKVLLPKAVLTTDDSADALAIALCHAQNRAIRTRLAAG